MRPRFNPRKSKWAISKPCPGGRAGAGVDEAVLKKVDDERQQEPGGDLLSANGKDELGERPVV